MNTQQGGHSPQQSELIPLLQKISQQLEEISKRVQDQSVDLENLRYSSALNMQSEFFHKIHKNQLSYLEFVERIASKKLSLARFGDGEIILASNGYANIGFQRGSVQLMRHLQKIIADPHPDILVTFPGFVTDRYWMRIYSKFWPVLGNIIPDGQIYGATNITRAGGFSRDGMDLVEAWRSCWENRHVTVVTGKGSRFDLIDELFSGVKDATFEYSLPKNAYDEHKTILGNLLNNPQDLVLISLGPTGSILAYELAKRGVQALDLGHISASYQQAFKGAPTPEKLPLSK